MKSLSLVLLASAFASAIELPQSEGFAQQEYESGLVHETLMSAKHASWDRQRAQGQMDSTQYPSLTAPVKCLDGLAIVEPGNANQTFKCKNMDLLDFKSHADLGSFAGEGSSSWGWVSDDGREFVAIGQADGTAFAEISPEGKLIYLGRLPQQSVFSIWREIRTYKNYAIIGSEAVGHGVQIFDWTKLLSIDPTAPVNFSTTADLTGLFADLPVGRTHNVVIHEELDYAVAVGAQPRNSSCAAGLIFIDLSDPSNPTSPGCAGQDGYVHDAQCVVYHGPDSRYEGVDICYGYNEDTLTIYDVTDKTGLNTSRIISKTSYVGARYTHQGWLLDSSYQQYLLLDDELDEEYYTGPAADRYPVTYIFDISDLENPVQTGLYKSKAYSIDHNQYIFDGLDYQSNYGAGIRVLDVSSIPHDPTGASIEEIAFFDIYPEDDHLENGGIIDFVGTWSHYAGFPSGNVFVNTIERGAFVVKMNQFEKRGRGAHYKKPRNV
ncbi:uncharacterized protein Z518_00635 [Rhinocladiella mackenziei CBS 650.93]|uniref:Regulatory P domain-containing protein n=1 Tax=Rhinocladiella mackenziei CBS 650.93 TaxID=1442369 RepID=A0A0D2JJG8_9EURO|nr:uncharacterized protein Z518_00635 [Rhinocladiella mackenziei CBS 650.93]KIX09555.1 hypothetical protein Z518_00635 [Rhinocladiella mackenziei CBS 650.93]